MEDLGHMLARLQQWEPLDWDGVLDDLDAVLGEQVPEEDQVAPLAERLRGALNQVVIIALGGHADVKDAAAAELIVRARALPSELPGDRWAAVGLVRRLGWVTAELLDRLTVVGIVKGVE